MPSISGERYILEIYHNRSPSYLSKYRACFISLVITSIIHGCFKLLSLWHIHAEIIYSSPKPAINRRISRLSAASIEFVGIRAYHEASPEARRGTFAENRLVSSPYSSKYTIHNANIVLCLAIIDLYMINTTKYFSKWYYIASSF